MASKMIRGRPEAPLFTSAKTGEPIPIPTRMRLETLVQATLNPAVFRIEYVADVAFERTIVVPLEGIVLCGEGRRQLIELPDEEPPRDIDEEGLRLLAIEKLGLSMLALRAADISRLPLAANARLAWRARNFRVDVDDHVRVLAHLEDTSPSNLLEAAALVRNTTSGVSAVLAMACADLIEIDLVSAPLGPWTAVSRRRKPTISPESQRASEGVIPTGTTL